MCSPSVSAAGPLVVARSSPRGGGEPLVILGTTVYSDANAIEVLCITPASGARRPADVVAGPKVYSNVSRRFSSLCSARSRSTEQLAIDGEAVMNPGRLPRRTSALEIGRSGCAGDALLIFGGLRSAQDRCALAGRGARYLESLISILPWASRHGGLFDRRGGVTAVPLSSDR